MGIFLPPPIEAIFLDFFQNRPNKVISIVHNVFWDQLEVPEHISDIIFTFQALFDSPQHEKAMETTKIAVFRPFGAYKA